MKPHLAPFSTLLFSIADTFFGFVLYVHGSDIWLFAKDVFEYDFRKSVFEFWLFSVVRTVVLVAGTIGLIFNLLDGKKFIRASRCAVGGMTTIITMYTVAKILVYTEYVDSYHDNDVWFWTSASWAIVASVIMYGLWTHILTNVKPLLLNNFKELDTRLYSQEETERSDEGEDDEDNDLDVQDSEDNKSDSRKMSDQASKHKGRLQRETSRSQNRPSAILKLLKLSKPDWHFLLMAFIALLLASVGEVFLPLYTGKVIDGIVIAEDKPKFKESIIVMTILSTGVAFGKGVRKAFFNMAMARLNLRITTILYDSIMEQEVGFFDKTRTGAITSRLSSDTATISNALSSNLNNCLRSVFKILGYVIFMIIISWRLTVVTLVSFPLLWVITDIFGSYYKKLASQVQTSLAEANIIAEETISSVKTVRSFANEASEKDIYRSKLNITFRLRKKESVALCIYKIGSSMCERLMFVATLLYGGHLVMNGIITGGMLVSFILYQLELGTCLEDIGDVVASLEKAVGASEKVFQLIDRKPVFKNDGHLAPARFFGHLEFRDVSFAYPARPSIPVLKNVSFTASPGEVLALVGPSGGGKSSCVALLEHFYEPVSGEVLLDGINVKDYEHVYLHNKIALVGQEPVLYARSIRDNIAYGLGECSTERILEAARLANAHNFISHLKKGYETETGEKGLQLSGGQKQRVAIARALVRNPQMLLLDEATSALDAESEHLVQQAIMNKFASHSIVVVAHRLSTIEKADRIVVIDQGMVVEQGKHQGLIKSGGLYAQLVRRQLLGLDNEEAE